MEISRWRSLCLASKAIIIKLILVPKLRSSPPRSHALGNGTCFRSFASLGVANDNHTKAVQLPGQVRSQVQYLFTVG